MDFAAAFIAAVARRCRPRGMTRPRRDGLPGNGVRATLAGPDPNWSEFFPAERASALKLLFTRLGIGVDTVEIRRRVDHSGRGMAGEDNLAWLRGPASVPTKRQQPSDHVDPPSSRGRPSRCGSGAPVSEMRRGPSSRTWHASSPTMSFCPPPRWATWDCVAPRSPITLSRHPPIASASSPQATARRRQSLRTGSPSPLLERTFHRKCH